MILSVVIASALYGLVYWLVRRVSPDPARQKLVHLPDRLLGNPGGVCHLLVHVPDGRVRPG